MIDVDGACTVLRSYRSRHPGAVSSCVPIPTIQFLEETIAELSAGRMCIAMRRHLDLPYANPIGIGRGLTASPLPHHRTYGSRIRRFGRCCQGDTSPQPERRLPACQP